MSKKRLFIAGVLSALVLGTYTARAEDGNLAFSVGTSSLVFATEMFGGGAVEVGNFPISSNISGSVPALGMRVLLQVKTDSGLSHGASGTITFRLRNNAQFGYRRITDDDLFVVPSSASGGNTDNTIRTTVLSGGNVGDNFVNFRVDTVNPAPDGGFSLRAEDNLVFYIPGLRNLILSNIEVGANAGDVSQGVGVDVSTAPITVLGDGSVGNFQTSSPITDDEAGNDIRSDRIMFHRQRYDLSMLNPGSSTIDFSNRSSFLPRDSVLEVTVMEEDAEEPRQQSSAILGSIGLSERTRSREHRINAMGALGFLPLRPADRVRISVAGDIKAGDIVFLDLNRNNTVDEGEELVGGSASFALEKEEIPMGGMSTSPEFLDVFLTRLVETSNDVYEAPAVRRFNIVYVPGPATGLTPTSFVTTAVLDFRSPIYQDDTATETVSLNIGTGTLSEEGFAYAVPNCTQTERSMINITNEDIGPVSVFVQGYAQDGTELGFNEVDASEIRGSGESTIAGGETLSVQTHDLERIFGLNDGSYERGSRCALNETVRTWAGRAQMTFISDGNITVLPLIINAEGAVDDLGTYSGLSVMRPFRVRVEPDPDAMPDDPMVPEFRTEYRRAYITR